jgi:hypothetical protein
MLSTSRGDGENIVLKKNIIIWLCVRNKTALRSSDELSSRDQVSRKELVLSSVPEVLSINSNGKGIAYDSERGATEEGP